MLVPFTRRNSVQQKSPNESGDFRARGGIPWDSQNKQFPLQFQL